jgi:hypothetical protein
MPRPAPLDRFDSQVPYLQPDVIVLLNKDPRYPRMRVIINPNKDKAPKVETPRLSQ